MMRLVLFFLLISVFQTIASAGYSQNTKITLKGEALSLVEVLNRIEDQSECRFIYDKSQINLDQKVKVSFDGVPVKDVLEALFAGQGINHQMINNQIILTRLGSGASQQTGTVSGQVTDSSGAPLPGVTVMLKGTTQGTITDGEGNYSLSNVSRDATLVFSFVGMKSQEIPITGRTNINVSMVEESIGIEEVVTIGYGTQKKRDIIGSVSVIKAADMMRTIPSSIDQALQGMATGVMVSSSAGVPGSPVQVKIRGINSIHSGTDPLWVIDGIPVIQGNTGSSYDGEINQNVLSMVNPSDIESIQVLKDAAATSIYGSRGSNGVILVTTKSGKKGRAVIKADLKTGISQFTCSDIGLASSSEYMQIMDLAYTNSNKGGIYNPQSSLNQLDGLTTSITRDEALAINTDWVDAITHVGTNYEANFSVSQGSDNGDTYLSLKYLKNEGVVKHNSLEMFSANFNVNHNFRDIFNLGYRLMASFTDNDRVKSGDGKGGEGGWGQVNSNSLPWMKIYEENDVNGFWNPLTGVNALAGISPVNVESNLQTLNLISGLTGTLYLPVKGLTLKGEVGVNFVYDKGLSWRGNGIRLLGEIAKENKNQRFNLNYNTFINYDGRLGDAHYFNVAAGVENTRSINHYTSLTGEELVGTYREVGTPNTLWGSSYLGGETYLRGYFGRVNYKFMDKYLLGASIRRDGISKFTSQNRWATFTSFSAGWIISDESFFTVDAISLLKLRGSFGQTGNTNLPSGITSDDWSIRSGTGTFQNLNSIDFESIGNSNLRWETTSTIDVGLDFALIHNRVEGSVAYYKQDIKDMLLQVALPQSAGIQGGNSIWQNVGDMKNDGIEISFNAHLLDKTVKWTLGGNLTTNKNKVLAMDPDSDRDGVGIITEAEGSISRTIIKAGLPIGTWYMAESAGVDPEKGIPMIYEVETLEDGTTAHTGNIIPGTETNINNNRMMLKGKSSIPKVVGGFNNYLAYRNFDLNMAWSFSLGHYIYNRVLQSSLTPNRGMLVLSKELLTDSWENPGDRSKWPQVVSDVQYFYDEEGVHTPSTGHKYGSDNNTPSTMYLEKGDYLRLSSLQIGYSLPKSITQRIYVDYLRIYANASNLLTFTKFSGYDPEIPIDANTGTVAIFSTMPQMKIFSLGVNLIF